MTTLTPEQAAALRLAQSIVAAVHAESGARYITVSEVDAYVMCDEHPPHARRVIPGGSSWSWDDDGINYTHTERSEGS